MNEFEKNLAQYYPEVYALFLLAKEKDSGGGGEKNLYTLIEALVSMNALCESGTLLISYSKGHIDKISKQTDLVKRNMHQIPRNGV
jgi:hypothetical protein